jgi:Xaa-Pro aminopeptidase
MPLDHTLPEDHRAAALRHAQTQANALFEAIGTQLIRPGISESQLNDEIHALAAATFGVETHWHKRVIRSGPNTLCPYVENPPDRVITDDDILFIDLGPVFAAWEADFGRTYVLGNDPVKHRLAADLEPLFNAGRAYFESHPDITGGELYDTACRLAAEAGWEFGGTIAGHLVGEFPHETLDGDRLGLYITAGNTLPLRNLDADGRKRHWILEIHLIDRARQIGGFYEQLLTI